MIGRTNAGSGGGVLNFKVVGGTSAPSSPKENTIWVNTSVAITGWVFSATAPSSPAAGLVWIPTGESSTVEFNALKKNGIQVYPVSAKQYVGGAWSEKTAKSYQNSEWVDWWSGELYTPGNEYESITGGWVCKEKCGSSYLGLSVLTKEKTRLKVYTVANDGGLVRCSNKIDVTNYDTLSVTATSSIDIFVLSDLTLNAWSPANIKAKANLSGAGTKTLDISALAGEFYIAIGHAVADGSSSITFYITEVRMA